MANPEHLAKLLEGREAWNAWRKENPELEPDLRGASLRRMNLSGFNLNWVHLSRANLEEIDLVRADIAVLTAYETNWTGARIIQSRFHLIDAMRSNFQDAVLKRNLFEHSNLAQASFIDADIGGTVFARCNLGEAQGLEYTRGNFVSVGIDTFFESGGLPETFLRAANAPEEFITYAASLTGKVIEYYSCFISYSSKDDEFTRRLHADLQARKIKTWFAPEDLKIGDRFRTVIEDSIRIHDKLVLVLSQHSIESAWVRREVEAALEREDREKKDILFPVRLDDTIFESNESWAAEIRRSRNIGDFHNWKSHDDYTKSLDRLVKDLKKEGPIVMR